MAPTTSNANLTIGKLTLGSGVSGAAAGNTWGANGWDGPTDAAGAASAGNYATFSFTANAGFQLSLTDIAAYNVRRSGTGPSQGIWQYSLDGSSFTSIGNPITWGGTTTASGNPQGLISLSGISALQNVAAGTTVTFRVVNWGSNNAAGTWYFNGGGTNKDLIIDGTVSPASGGGDPGGGDPGTGDTYYWVGADAGRGGDGTWTQTGGTSWATTDADVAGAAWNSSKIADFKGTGGTVTVSGGGVNANGGIKFETGGYVVTGDPVTLGAANATVANAGDTARIASVLAGNAGLNKDGAGTLVLDADNTYTGNTTITNGTLQVGNGAARGTISGDVANNGTLVFNRTDTITFAGNIGPVGAGSSSGNIVQAGAGTVIVTGTLGSSTAPANLTVNSGGTVQIGDGGTTGNLWGPVTNNGTLIYNRSANLIQSDSVSGNGAVVLNGTGSVVITGNFSHTGGTTINAGTLQVGNGTFFAGNLSGNVVVNSPGTLAFNRGDDMEFAGVISGTGNVTHLAGGSTLTLSGNNTYSGTTTIAAAAIVRASNNNSLGASTVHVNGATLLVNGGLTIANAITVNPGASVGGTNLADWTFDASAPTTAGPFAPEGGVNAGSSNASGFHAGSTTYSSPVGNGSSKSFSSTAWAVGDYYQFTTSTVGYDGISFGFDQASSNTGPGQFQLAYSTDGTNFTNFDAPYTVLANASPNPTWSGSGTPHTEFTFAYDLSGVAALNDQPTVYFRLVDASTTSAAGGTVAAGGTDRVDNVLINGNPILGGGEPTASATVGSDAGGDTVTFTGNMSLNAPVNLRADGSGTVAFTGSISGSSAIIKIGDGTVHLGGANTFGGGTYVNAGTLVVDHPQALGTGGLTVHNSAKAIMTTGPAAAVGVATLSISDSAQLDIADGKLAIKTGDPSTVRQYLQNGRSSGSWTGTNGIVSSVAAADAQGRQAIGYATGAQLLGLSGGATATWFGQTVDASSLLVRFTWYGDANLDGTVGADDYALIDRGFAMHVTDAHWTDGDFNYDGTVNSADYLLIDTVFAQSNGGVLSPAFLAARESQFGSEYVAELTAAVPEPGTLGAAVALALPALARRRRR